MDTLEFITPVFHTGPEICYLYVKSFLTESCNENSDYKVSVGKVAVVSND
jgi:hypothetical protein